MSKVLAPLQPNLPPDHSKSVLMGKYGTTENGKPRFRPLQPDVEDLEPSVLTWSQVRKIYGSGFSSEEGPSGYVFVPALDLWVNVNDMSTVQAALDEIADMDFEDPDGTHLRHGSLHHYMSRTCRGPLCRKATRDNRGALGVHQNTHLLRLAPLLEAIQEYYDGVCDEIERMNAWGESLGEGY